MNNKQLPAMPLRGADGIIIHHNDIMEHNCTGFTKEEVVFKDIFCAIIMSGNFSF